MYLELNQAACVSIIQSGFNLLWRSNVFGTFVIISWSGRLEYVSISFGDLMYLERAVRLVAVNPALVSISFGDLMYLERYTRLNSHHGKGVSISFGDLMYLELFQIASFQSLSPVSISFGDLMYLEPSQAHLGS